ncbi:hypothetical protein JCM8547_003284 [Rhodosporidiobolus lusitaniae]
MDDLLDLDFASSNSIKPTKPNPQAGYGGRSAFDYLAGSSASARAPTPAMPLQPTRTPTPSQQAKQQPKPAGGDAFAGLFGTSPASAPQQQDKGLSMAERLQTTSSASFGAYGRGAAGGTNFIGGFANGTGSRAGSPANLSQPIRAASPAVKSPSLLPPTSVPSRSSTLSPSPAPAIAVSTKPSDPWDFDMLSSSIPAKPTSSSPAPADDLFDMGFESLPSSRPAPTSTASPPSQAADDFDLLDAFAAPASRAPPAPSPAAAPSSSANPPLRNGASSPPPHILGHLVEMGFSPAAARKALASPAAKKADGSFDVEAAVDTLMGGSGAGPASRGEEQREEPVLDEVERRRRERQKRDEDEWGEEENVKIGRRRSWEFEDDDRAAEQREREALERRKRKAAAEKEKQQQAGESSAAPAPGGPSRLRPRERNGERPSAAAGEEPIDPAVVLQQQAQAALAQAQKLGFSAFKTASSFWGQGKEVLQKKIEEQRQAARVAAGLPGGSGERGEGGVAHNGRPKWWRQGMELDGEEGGDVGNGKGRADEAGPPPTSFKDSDDEGEMLPQRPQPPRSRPPPPKQQQAPPAPAAAPASSEYRSPFRRAKAAPSPAPAATPEGDLLSASSAPPPSSARSSAVAPPPSRSPAPSPAPRSPSRSFPPRPPIPVSPSSLSSALAHKETGNAYFKLGRFGDASIAYSLALDALPPHWIGRVPLLNNRAQSRLRSGEEKMAAEDCGEALGILLLPYGPKSTPERFEADVLPALEGEGANLSAEVVKLTGGTSVDLRDQLGKALGRRAKALEATEKWKNAGEDWDRLLRLGEEKVVVAAGGRKLVNEGSARCRKMLGGGGGPSSSPSASTPSRPTPSAASKPRPAAAAAARPRPPPVPVQGSGDAVRALQASQRAAAEEDDLRHALKDTVEAKILAWKGGKETNLRALIASLEDVLWPELGWKKVGMHEVIGEGQVKVKYVRAIAKVHPDKLNVNNTTVEQRMIAGLVFATLNEAWNATK